MSIKLVLVVLLIFVCLPILKIWVEEKKEKKQISKEQYYLILFVWLPMIDWLLYRVLDGILGK